MTEVSNTTPLLGESCPKCGSAEWNPITTEPGERERRACANCDMWLALTVKKVKPPKPAKRPFSFTFEIDKGRLFIDWRDNPILAFKPGAYLAVGGWELLSDAEAERREEQATMVGRIVEQRLAEESAA